MNRRNISNEPGLAGAEFSKSPKASLRCAPGAILAWVENHRGCLHFLFAGLITWGCLQGMTGMAAVFVSQTYEQFDGLEALVIPDGSSAGVSDTRTIGVSTGELTSMSVSLDISTQFNGDIYGYLVHEDRIAILLNRSGTTASDRFGYADSGFRVTLSASPTDEDIHTYRSITTPGTGLPLTGNWQADGRLVDPDSVINTDSRLGTLSVFNGCNPYGNWTLYLADLSAGGASSLNSWTLDITAIPEPATATGLIGATLLGLAWWRRQRQHRAG
jgi:subtilisin-like proprotein convertase family protein